MRALLSFAAIVSLAGVILLAGPAPGRAEANPLCDVGAGPVDAVSGGVGAITGGAIGGGNPVGDACNEVTDGAVGTVTAPLTGAVEGLGNSIFAQITDWTSDGAAWLIKRVAAGVESSTTPQLRTKGFVESYAKMALIGALLAVAMLLAAVLEGIARGDVAMLGRVVLVNVPLALIATSVAYVIVQMALVATDGLCHAVGAASGRQVQEFFASAIKGLGSAGGEAGEAAGTIGPTGPAAGKAGGEVAAPLFVIFLAAIVGGLAAFCVWLELLMRDAAVYVVALFAPLALAASIWPRWSGTLRKSAELLAVVIASKFVIVAIIALAAGLVSDGAGGIEHVLAAAALMVLACFSPFVLFRLVPLAEGAIGAAYGRRHAASGTSGTMRNVSSTAQTVRRAAQGSWDRGSGKGGGGVSRFGLRGAPGAAGAGRAAGSVRAAGAGAAAAGGVAVAGSLPIAAARGAQAGAERLAASGTAQAAGSKQAEAPVTESKAARTDGRTGAGSGRQGGGAEQGSSAMRPPAVPRPGDRPSGQSGQRPEPPPTSGGEGPPRPAPEPPRPRTGGEER